MNIVERISKILKAKKLSQKALTDHLGLKQSAFTDWKNGKTESYLNWIREIAIFLNVSTDYLYFGKESQEDLTEDEKRLIAAYRNQSEEGKKYIHRSLGIEEPSSRPIDSDPKSELQTEIGKAFTKTTT